MLFISSNLTKHRQSVAHGRQTTYIQGNIFSQLSLNNVADSIQSKNF